MSSEIVRMGILLILLLLGFVFIKYENRKRYINKKLGTENIEYGIPAILYFTTPLCQICKSVQKPELNKIKKLLKNKIQIIEVNAMEENKLADYWGVLSVPTTFIIDSEGRPRKINIGVTSSGKLLTQVKKVNNP